MPYDDLGKEWSPAVGIVLSLHHLDQTWAIDMLVRLSQRARRQIHEVAATIADTGVVPDPDAAAAAGSVSGNNAGSGDQSGGR